MSESGTPAALRCTAQCIPQLTKPREELKSCAKRCATAGAMELATLREELKLRKMLRYCRRNETQQGTAREQTRTLLHSAASPVL